jgi:hypothetical protein
MLDPWLASSVRQIPTFSVAGPSVCPVAGAAIDGLVEVPSRRMTASKFAAGLLATLYTKQALTPGNRRQSLKPCKRLSVGRTCS